MARRSNSWMLPTDDNDSAVAPETETISDEIEEIVLDAPLATIPHGPSQLARASVAADRAAARGTFARYQAKLSANTRRQQAAALELWVSYLSAAGVHVPPALGLMAEPDGWAEVTWGLVQGFSEWMLAQGYAIATVNARLSTIRTYCKLAHQAGMLDQEQYSKIRLVQGYAHKQARNVDREREVTRVGDKKAEHVSISLDQANRLKQQPSTSPQGRRDALLMCLLLDHGLRCGEVAGLQVDDFDIPRGIFTFYREKVDKKQTHRLEPDALDAARAYFAYDAPAEGQLLRGSRKNGSLTDGGMSDRAITKRVAVLGAEIGIPGLSAHDCRHYWATNAARSGTDAFALRDGGGWSSLAMPSRYVEDSRIANENVKLTNKRRGDEP